MSRGKIIVIEGTDGSGKATQTKLLKEYYAKKKLKGIFIDFPYYDCQSGEQIRSYLTGKYYHKRDMEDDMIGASMLYAVNRHQVLYARYFHPSSNEKYPRIIDYLEDGYDLIFDRYTTSNMLYMGSNIYTPAVSGKKRSDAHYKINRILKTIKTVEFDLMKLPKPDKVIILRVHPETSINNLVNRYKTTEYLEDINENLPYLEKVHSFIEPLKDLYCKDLNIDIIDCDNKAKKMYATSSISRKILRSIRADDIL